MNLRECADTLNGYGADLARQLIESPGDMSEADADALFRTLVLHDDVGLEDARQAFGEASDALAESRPLAGETASQDDDMQALALACSDLARSLIRSLSELENQTLHAVEAEASNVLARRSSTLVRLKFLQLTETKDGRTVLSRTGKTVRMYSRVESEVSQNG